MRAEARHQLKEDRFSKATFGAAENAVHWTLEHQSKLIAAALAVIVIAAIGVGGWYYLNLQDEKASAAFSTATRTMETPVRPTGVPAQPGYETFASLQERATAARKQFQAIVDKYPHTRTALMARYFVGLNAAQTGDYSAAEDNLRQVNEARNKDLAALAKLALASVYRSENKDSQVPELYRQLIDKPTPTVSKVAAQLELASFYESRQKPDEAKRIYDQIQKEDVGTEAAAIAQQRANELK